MAETVDIPPTWVSADYYAELGVSPDADASEITRAYRRLAKAHHPDAAGDAADAERFARIAAAYEVLGNPESRRRYDAVRQQLRTGAAGAPPGFGGGFGFGPSVRFGDFGEFGDFVEFDDGSAFAGAGLFDELFARRAARPRRGPDYTFSTRIGFRASVTGTTIPLRFGAPVRCTVCGGTGHAGDGACGGCAGAGETTIAREVTVRLPPGVRDGERVKVSGQGGPGGNGGPPGDLLVSVHVDPDPVFSRQGTANLEVTVTVSYPRAVLGGPVHVPTLDGSVTVQLAPGTASGTVQRLRGKGVVRPERPAGDLLVRFVVEVPVNLTDAQRAAVRALDAALDVPFETHFATPSDTPPETLSEAPPTTPGADSPS